MRRGCALALIVVTIGAGCGKSATTSTPAAPSPAAEISQQARGYLDALIGIMQSSSVNRLTIDWNAFRTSVFSSAGAAQTIPDTFGAIRTALTLLRDGHSSYTPASGSTIFVPTRSCTASGAGTPSLPPTIGYVKVTSFSGSTAQATAFANGIRDAIAAADRDGLAGWIVDLGEGVVGHFIDPAGVEAVWEYRAGASINSGFVVTRVDTPFTLRRERPRVAVLTDNGVASSGEAVVVAFRQRPDTRSFGAATCGLSTANRPFTLSDGANLNLTVSTMADRMKMKYGDTIAPDEVITDPAAVVQRAIEWLTTGS